MRLYEGTVAQFKKDVMENKIADLILEKYQGQYGRNSAPSEFNAWTNSLNFVKNVLEYSGLEENEIVLEFGLPFSSGRIDVLLFGKDPKHEDNVVLIELKQWSNQYVHDSDVEECVLVDYGRRRSITAHPASQVQGYHYYLTDFMLVFQEDPRILLSSCSYCHNYSKFGSPTLYAPKFSPLIDRYPLFSKEDMPTLAGYIKERLSQGSGLEVFNRFIRSPIRPAKGLITHVHDMVNKQQIFTLIEDQIPAYNAILHKAKKLSRSSRKSVIIVKGGPGTGKSVIALEVMGELMRAGKTVFHATGSSAFTKTLRQLLGKRCEHLFKFFFSFTKHRENEIDVLICDEAHRIRKNSADWGVPWNLKSANQQVDDLIRPARLTIFFIDEHQVVRPTEIGNVGLIKESARRLGVDEDEITEFELRTQFRCSGSDAYLQWLEGALGITESDKKFLTPEEKIEFRIFEDPLKLKEAIEEKNRLKPNSARIVAGFCWPWSEQNKDGTLVDDVVIGNFKMPWEDKSEFWKWATHGSGMGQVGTVYTAQGFEFDYIGVIFGKDLAYDSAKGAWVAKPENSYDNMVKRGNKKLTEHLKNVYRVLMSRAHKGCYVHFMDKETEAFFKSRIKNSQ